MAKTDLAHKVSVQNSMTEFSNPPEIATHNPEQYNLGAFVRIMLGEKYLLIREHDETVKKGKVAKYGAIGGRAAFKHLPTAESTRVQIGALEVDHAATLRRNNLLSYLGIKHDDIVPKEDSESRHQLRFSLSPSQAAKLRELLCGPQPALDLSSTARVELVEELCEENNLLPEVDVKTAELVYVGQWEGQKKQSKESKENPHHLRSIYDMILSEDMKDKLLDAVTKSNGTLILASEEDIRNGRIGGCEIDWKTACILPPESPSTTT
jgi:hypothetical protein